MTRHKRYIYNEWFAPATYTCVLCKREVTDTAGKYTLKDKGWTWFKVYLPETVHICGVCQDNRVDEVEALWARARTAPAPTPA